MEITNHQELEVLRQQVLENVTAKVVCHSIGPHDVHLLTQQVCMPRMVLAEFNTHRAFDRNSASSRAIPVEKQLNMIVKKPYYPFYFGANQSGMQAKVELEGDDLLAAANNFSLGRDFALLQAVALMGGKATLKDKNLVEYFEALDQMYPDIAGRFTKQSIGLHKQNANRVLEPYMWHTVVVTSTDWANFYALRCDKDAQPEIRATALKMINAHYISVPKKLGWSDWHLPYLDDSEKEQLSFADRKKVSTGRIARTSYLTHDGKRDFSKDIELHDDLLRNGHMSPFGQVASPDPAPGQTSNLYGYHQYRKEVSGESNFSTVHSEARLLKGLDGDQKLVEFLRTIR